MYPNPPLDSLHCNFLHFFVRDKWVSIRYCASFYINCHWHPMRIQNIEDSRNNCCAGGGTCKVLSNHPRVAAITWWWLSCVCQVVLLEKLDDLWKELSGDNFMLSTACMLASVKILKTSKSHFAIGSDPIELKALHYHYLDLTYPTYLGRPRISSLSFGWLRPNHFVPIGSHDNWLSSSWMSHCGVYFYIHCHF